MLSWFRSKQQKADLPPKVEEMEQIKQEDATDVNNVNIVNSEDNIRNSNNNRSPDNSRRKSSVPVIKITSDTAPDLSKLSEADLKKYDLDIKYDIGKKGPSSKEAYLKEQLEQEILKQQILQDEQQQHQEHLMQIQIQNLPQKQEQQCTDAHIVTIKGPILWGQDKWLGGVASPDGKWVYGAPGHAKRVLRINTETEECDLIGPEFHGQFKWLRGAESPRDGMLYCLPSNRGRVLRINPANHEVDEIGPHYDGDWMWHGGNIGVDLNVYGIPANAKSVLKIDTLTGEVSTIAGPFEGRQKWYGGLNGANGCIYGIPQNSTGVLKINPTTQSADIIYPKDGPLDGGGWKWHGGVVTPDGCIYGIPSNADQVIKIDSKTDEVTLIGKVETFKSVSGSHRNGDGKYKYLGGGINKDATKLYLFPADAKRVMEIDLKTDVCTPIGPDFDYIGFNKWQNGFCAWDGAVYAIPQRAPGILRIAPNRHNSSEPGIVTMMDCGAVPPDMWDKCEGGVMGGDGCIYCIPLRAKHVVKIVPEKVADECHQQASRMEDECIL